MLNDMKRAINNFNLILSIILIGDYRRAINFAGGHYVDHKYVDHKTS